MKSTKKGTKKVLQFLLKIRIFFKISILTKSIQRMPSIKKLFHVVFVQKSTKKKVSKKYLKKVQICLLKKNLLNLNKKYPKNLSIKEKIISCSVCLKKYQKRHQKGT